jgi:hypothetical protein
LCFPWLGGLGFFCMLEVLCVVFVYLEALDAFFLVYNTLTYQKKKKKEMGDVDSSRLTRVHRKARNQPPRGKGTKHLAKRLDSLDRGRERGSP